VLVAVALTQAAGVARAQEVTADVLLRAAPAVVRIKADDDAVGSGFIYPTSKHVTTAYTAINHHGDLTVVLADGKSVPARVVAWSDADDLAILELGTAVNVAPLELEPQRGFTGERVALLGYPALSNPEDVERPPRRDSPTPRFGTVSLVSPTQVNIDVGIWTGDRGAPFLTANGRVLGVLSGKRERSLGTADAATVSQIDSLRTQVGKFGEFDPTPPGDGGVFAGFYVSPWGAYHEVGAGILTGWRYRWIALNLATTFSHASFTPLNATQMRARWSYINEAYVSANWNYTRHRQLCFGSGLRLRFTTYNVKQDGQSVDLPPEDAGTARLDPFFVIQDIEGPVLFGVSYAPLDSAARLDIGIVFGRN
jgi:hypothetical protein